MAKKNKEKKEKFVDDGRVIAPMNVDGMPWYDPRQPKTDGEESTGQVQYKYMSKEEKKAYRKETRGMIFGMLKYVIPIGLFFMAGFGILIYFLTVVWR